MKKTRRKTNAKERSEKRKPKEVLKSYTKLEPMPNNLNDKACKRLICAILNQAWRDSKDNDYNGDIPSFLDSKLCDSLCCYADIDTKEYKEVVSKRWEFAKKAKERSKANNIDKPTGAK